MLDPKILKENPQSVADMLNKRKLDYPINDLLVFDKTRRELIIKMQELQHKKNILANSIGIKKRNNDNGSAELEEMKEIGRKINDLSQKKVIVETKFRDLMMMLPNLIDKSVPVGNNENDNLVIKKHIQMPNQKLNFKTKDHVDIANELDLIDLERAAKISGARFYFLKNDLVMMNQGLIHFALDLLSKKGYILTQPPYMIKRDAMEGSIILEDFKEVIYKIEEEDLYMIGTSEHALASMHMNEILDGKKLPIRYASISPCFRKEAGAHGRDMKGIFRVHQFEKVEQFVYARPEESSAEHDKMLAVTEELYEKLAIPYRVVLLCSAELGKASSKTYDIEAWMPAQGAYREIGSCSNCVDYQSRRLGIRFRDKTNEETRLVHSLNSTVVATERTMVAIIENYQTVQGTIEVPDALQKYMGDIKEITLQNNAN
jgi:seryl-tRNA synthetase